MKKNTIITCRECQYFVDCEKWSIEEKYSFMCSILGKHINCDAVRNNLIDPNCPLEDEGTTEIVCPHCGFEHQESHDFLEGYSGEFVCDECEKVFWYQVITTYRTRKDEPG